MNNFDKIMAGKIIFPVSENLPETTATQQKILHDSIIPIFHGI